MVYTWLQLSPCQLLIENAQLDESRNELPLLFIDPLYSQHLVGALAVVLLGEPLLDCWPLLQPLSWVCGASVHASHPEIMFVFTSLDRDF